MKLPVIIYVFLSVVITINGFCTPPENVAPHAYFFSSDCVEDKFNGPISIKSVDATQGSASVEQNGGLDLTQALKLNLTLVNNYKADIAHHQFGFRIWQFTNSEGKQVDSAPCEWYELETMDALDTIDASKIIHSDPRYKKKPTKVLAVIDFPKILSEYSEAAAAVTEILEPGTYYAFEVVERDGQTKLSCVRLQMKLKKVS